ncbi:hypothetical protein [Streptomyces hawaiiensis]|uniref:Uncharacterized protein n=1 Tax=Streptomyces hawaiiensis TaxID=67305 RepID=A0A6G5R7P9_9ACTN|nr:hypothetical protein [Streptomyces hawaiiensis]QCD53786.1 hypothetical protein CEB94_02005 [Streptomyces hawaiiensis]
MCGDRPGSAGQAGGAGDREVEAEAEADQHNTRGPPERTVDAGLVEDRRGFGPEGTAAGHRAMARCRSALREVRLPPVTRSFPSDTPVTADPA